MVAPAQTAPQEKPGAQFQKGLRSKHIMLRPRHLSFILSAVILSAAAIDARAQDEPGAQVNTLEQRLAALDRPCARPRGRSSEGESSGHFCHNVGHAE